MSKLMFLLLAVIALVMVSAVLAYQFGGIGGLVIAIVAIFIALRFVPKIAGFVMMRFLRKSMEAQGEPLRGATIEVHEVTAAPEPSADEYYDDDIFNDGYEGLDGECLDDEDVDEDIPMGPVITDLFYHGPRNWYYVDLSVYPAMRSDGRPTEYKPWYPSMLCLLGPERAAPKGLPMGSGALQMMDGYGNVIKTAIWRDETWDEDDDDEQFGPQRVRLHVGVKPDEGQFRVAYVNEGIGQIEIPGNA